MDQTKVRPEHCGGGQRGCHRCSRRCSEVQHEAWQTARLRALLARLVERLPPDDPLADEVWAVLE